MRHFTLLQQPIQDMPEYDSVVVRSVPELHDLQHWPKEFQRLAAKYLTVEPTTIVEHLIVCSTPPTEAGIKPSTAIATVINKLYQTFGTTYITL
jgi:hypothetical protein